MALLDNKRPWHSLIRNELIVWVGTLFHMGRHYEYNREYYWKEGHGQLGRHMAKTRWEQIHRFLRINTESERQPEQPWFYKLDPMMSTVRQNIQNAVEPASWLAVDELMIAYQGRSKHTIKIKNKPIKEGFKMWCLGFRGYIYTFRCHSGSESSEGIFKTRQFVQIEPLPSVTLAPTFQVPLVLCQHVRDLYPEQHYLVFLDNLFLNVEVAHCLLAIGFAVMGTTRKNAAGVPESLLAVKNQDKTLQNKTTLVYNSVLAVVVSFCLCFLWQDNNAVIVITTAHSIHKQEDRTERLRRRPKKTSTNASLSWPVFEGQSTKWLCIPEAIDDYNHSMNGVDTASQLRRGFTCHKPYDCKWWRPIFYWLIDICANNAYLIWKTTQSKKDHKLHMRFIDTLIDEMLEYDMHTPAPGNITEHHWERLSKRQQCSYGLKTKGGCVHGEGQPSKKRRCLGEISGNARATTKPREVWTGCKQCQVALCLKGDCWRRYHASQ